MKPAFPIIVAFVIGVVVGILSYHLFTISKTTSTEQIPVSVTPTPAIVESPPGEVFCTLDAKICPDGSSVGRIPPSCDFAPCPGE